MCDAKMGAGSLSGRLRLHLAQSEILDYQYSRALSYQLYGGASTGEVVRVAGLIKESGGTRADWVTVWTEQGRLSQSLGEKALAQGHPETARSFFLRAYNYLRAAEFFFDRKHDGAQAHRELYRQSVASFDGAMRLSPLPVEKVAIPYLEGITLPGYFFKASAAPDPLPTVIISGGGDSFGEESYFTAGVPDALARGLNALVFHGPGQRGLLHEHPDQIFRPDYEVPIGRIVDYALSRPDVDAARLGLYGYSFGGYLAPRTAAFDVRIKALAANAPLRDPHQLVLDAILAHLPAGVRALATRALNPAIELGMQRDWVIAATIEQSMLWPSGMTNVEEYLAFLRRFTLAGLENQLNGPVLCVSGLGEGEAAVRQAHQFFDALRCPKTFVALTGELGADSHVGLNNITYTSGIIYDWFHDVFAGTPPDIPSARL